MGWRLLMIITVLTIPATIWIAGHMGTAEGRQTIYDEHWCFAVSINGERHEACGYIGPTTDTELPRHGAASCGPPVPVPTTDTMIVTSRTSSEAVSSGGVSYRSEPVNVSVSLIPSENRIRVSVNLPTPTPTLDVSNERIAGCGGG